MGVECGVVTARIVVAAVCVTVQSWLSLVVLGLKRINFMQSKVMTASRIPVSEEGVFVEMEEIPSKLIL